MIVRFHEGYPILGDGNFEFLQGRAKYGQEVRDATFLSGFFLLLGLLTLGGFLSSYPVRPLHEFLVWLVIFLALAAGAAFFAGARKQSKKTYEYGVVKVGRIIAAQDYSNGEGDGTTLTLEVELDGQTTRLVRNVPFDFGCGGGDEMLVLCYKENIILM